MSGRNKGPAFYGVVTRTGGTVVRTWDEATAFLAEHPGAEFHKKWPTEPEAWAFVNAKLKELCGEASGEQAPPTGCFGPHYPAPTVTPSYPFLSADDWDGDDLPPW